MAFLYNVTCLKWFHWNSSFILLFHDFYQFAHNLIHHVIDMPTTLDEERKKKKTQHFEFF